mgnify:CR=1 FL=1
MGRRERGPEDIQKVVCGEVRWRWGAVVVASVIDAASTGVMPVEDVAEVDGVVTLTCGSDKNVERFREGSVFSSLCSWYC